MQIAPPQDTGLGLTNRLTSPSLQRIKAWKPDKAEVIVLPSACTTGSSEMMLHGSHYDLWSSCPVWLYVVDGSRHVPSGLTTS